MCGSQISPATFFLSNCVCCVVERNLVLLSGLIWVNEWGRRTVDGKMPSFKNAYIFETADFL